MFRIIAALWCILGVVLLLAYAIFSLYHQAAYLIDHQLTIFQYLVLIVAVAAMSYLEGYVGFQQGFSPRLAARAVYLSQNTNLINGILAPLFGMCYFGASPKRIAISLTVSCAIVLLIIAVGLVPQPWRSIIQAAVLAALVWGVVSIAIYSIKAFFGKNFGHAPEVH